MPKPSKTAHVNSPHIIVLGNPMDGIDFYGPFNTFTDALVVAEKMRINGNWWIAPLRRLEDI